jgi:anti-sigma-K factor RskA
MVDHPRHLLGSYVLGHLEADEGAALESHLEGCAECRIEAEELRAVATLLPSGDPSRLGATPPPPASLLDDVLVRIDGEREEGRRRRRRTFVLRGAVAATILALAVAAVIVVPAGPQGGEVVALAATRPGLSGQAVVHADTDATWIELTTAGLPAGETYAVWLEEEGTGERYRCGTFTAVAGEIYISLYSPLTRDRAAAIGVSSMDGAVLLESPLPTRPAV